MLISNFVTITEITPANLLWTYTFHKGIHTKCYVHRFLVEFIIINEVEFKLSKVVLKNTCN